MSVRLNQVEPYADLFFPASKGRSAEPKPQPVAPRSVSVPHMPEVEKASFVPLLNQAQREKIREEIARIAHLPPEEQKVALAKLLEEMVDLVLDETILQVLFPRFSTLSEPFMREMARVLATQIPKEPIHRVVREEIVQGMMAKQISLTLLIPDAASRDYVIQRIEQKGVDDRVDALTYCMIRQGDLDILVNQHQFFERIDPRVFDPKVTDETLAAEGGEVYQARWLWNKVTRFAGEFSEVREKTEKILGIKKHEALAHQIHEKIFLWARKRLRERSGPFTVEEFASLRQDLTDLVEQALRNGQITPTEGDQIRNAILSPTLVNESLMYEVACAQRILTFGHGLEEFNRAETAHERESIYLKAGQFYAEQIRTASDCRILGADHAKFLQGVSMDPRDSHQGLARVKEEILRRILSGSFDLDEYVRGLEAEAIENLDPMQRERLKRSLQDWMVEIRSLLDTKDRKITEVARNALAIFEISGKWLDHVSDLLTIERFEMVQDGVSLATPSERQAFDLEALNRTVKTVMNVSGQGAQAEEALAQLQVEAEKENLAEIIDAAHRKLEEKLEEFFVFFEHFLASLGFPIASMALNYLTQAMERKRRDRLERLRAEERWFHDWIVQTMERQRDEIPEKNVGRALLTLLAKSEAVS